MVTVHICQIINGLCWLVALILFAPSMLCWFKGNPSSDHLVRGGMWFVAAAQEGAIIRWFLFPDAIRFMPWIEIVTWSGLYIVSGVAWLILTYIAFFRTRQPRPC